MILIGWKQISSKLNYFPQRYVMTMMSFFCVMVAYTLRVCLNITIIQMVIPSKPKHIQGSNDCPDTAVDINHIFNNITMQSYGEYDWDEKTQGFILSAFYYGYFIMQTLSGPFIEKYGAKLLLGLGVGFTSIMTLYTPAVVRSGGNNPFGLIILRIAEGLVQGPIMPALSALMSRWAPLNERGIISSIIHGGALIGTILGTTAPGFIMPHNADWPYVFYIFGGLGILWHILWELLIYNDPRIHPYISNVEKEYLISEIEAKSNNPVPWKAMFSSMSIWALIISGIGHNYGFFILVTNLPKYMNNVLKFSITYTGLLLALPYIVMMATSLIFGVLCDYCIQYKYCSTRNARKIFTSIASFGPGLFVVLASYAGCDRNLAVVMFCIAMGTMGSYYSGMKTNILDLTPNYAGAAVSVIYGIPAISGIVAPYAVGYLTQNQTIEEWRIAFWILFGVLCVTNVFYIIFAEGEVQWWNDIDKNGYPSSWKKHGKKQKIYVQ